MRRLLNLAAVLAAAISTPALADRVIALGGGVTEIVYALGEGGRLAGVDSTSTFPAAARDLPQVGYVRALGAEGVLSLKPDLILAGAEAGPPEVLSKLESGGVRIVRIPDAETADAVPDRIRAVAAALGAKARGEEIAAGVAADLAALKQQIAGRTATPVVFVLTAGRGAPLSAGTGTAADTMIRLAGGRNVSDGMKGYKPLSAEALVGLNPEVIVSGSHVAEAVGGPQGLARLPELSGTPAARSGRVAVLDSLYLLGLGPRTAHAAHDLAVAIGGPLPALPVRPWLSPN
jgi:iron complex transport system substrate-binding protein